MYPSSLPTSIRIRTDVCRGDVAAARDAVESEVMGRKIYIIIHTQKKKEKKEKKPGDVPILLLTSFLGYRVRAYGALSVSEA